MANIFVSYNRKSEAIAKSLVVDLEALDNTVWFDQDLSGGQVWWDKILKTIRSCDVLIFVLDPISLNSTACKLEFGYAADLRKPIIPVLVAEDVPTNLLPPALSQLQFVDYRKQDRNAAFRLARALSTIPSPEPLPEPLPSPPEAPISYLTNLTEMIETTSSLDYEKQSTLLLDLKRSLRESDTFNDAQVLLGKLRKRRDLFATIAEEIDELLINKSAVTAPPNEPSEPLINKIKGFSSRATSTNSHNSPHSVELKTFDSFVKPAFALLGVLSLIFMIVSALAPFYGNDALLLIQIVSLLYYGLAVIACLLGYKKLSISMKTIRKALVFGVILGICMAFWTIIMDGGRITFDEVFLAWIAATLYYGALSWVVFSKI